MVRRDYGVELTGVSAKIKTIRRMRPGNANPFGSALLNGRGENVEIFASKHSSFSGVGIDGRHSDAGMPEFEASQFRVNEVNQLDIAGRRNLTESFPQR